MGRWRNRWSDRSYEPRPKLHKLSPERRAELLSQLQDGLAEAPVLSALAWTVHARRGRFYFEDEGEVVGRITPVGPRKLLLEVEGRSSWREVATGTSAPALVERIASDDRGTFHGLGKLDAVLRTRGTDRRTMCEAEGFAGEWFYVDLAPTQAPPSVVEVLYHAFGIPIPVIAEPRGWWERHRRPQIAEHQPDAVLVDFSQYSVSGGRFGGRCLYANREAGWGAYTIKPNQAASIETALAWLQKRRWQAW